MEYTTDQDIRPGDFNSLDIVTHDLTLAIFAGERNDDLDSPLLISFFDRVAEMGHFERLKLKVQSLHDWWQFVWSHDVTPVAEALLLAINASPNLAYLDLGNTWACANWAPHLKNMCSSMEQHKRLRTFVVPGKYKSHYGVPDDADSVDGFWADDGINLPSQLFDYSWLERLLSRNRNITVLDRRAIDARTDRPSTSSMR